MSLALCSSNVCAMIHFYSGEIIIKNDSAYNIRVSPSNPCQIPFGGGELIFHEAPGTEILPGATQKIEIKSKNLPATGTIQLEVSLGRHIFLLDYKLNQFTTEHNDIEGCTNFIKLRNLYGPVKVFIDQSQCHFPHSTPCCFRYYCDGRISFSPRLTRLKRQYNHICVIPIKVVFFDKNCEPST